MPGELAAVFAADAFQFESLTQSFMKIPFQPSRIKKMGLFGTRGARTKTAIIEEVSGELKLISTAPRGAPGSYYTAPKRKARSFPIPHIPYNDEIAADDVLGVRAFGSTSEMKSAQREIADHLKDMRRRHELTLEYHRIGALQGLVKDADAVSTVTDLFTEFSITESEVDFLFGSTTTPMRQKCLDVIRLIELALGAGSYNHIHAFCGKKWFSQFVDHSNVTTAYARWHDGEALRNDPRSNFPFAGIIFEEYRGIIDSVPFIPDDVARFFPIGVDGLFMTHYAPANFMETVNTKGLPLYAKTKVMDFDMGVLLHTQQNPLNICNRPEVLVKGVSSS